MQPTLELSDIRPRYDVVVIGAGPGGCAAAGAFARKGASVLLVESNPAAARRFAGEWIHPEGARVLDELGLLEGLHPRVGGRGFVVFPNDGLGPIRLNYSRKSGGFACEHATLVTHLRRRVAALEGVDYLEGARANDLVRGSVTLRRGRQLRLVQTPLAVAAVGRSVKKLLALESDWSKVSISLMAGLILRDAELPFEEYGHVIAGGPGPVLAYRIAPRQVRLCIDVQYDGRRPRDTSWIKRDFAEVLPSSLRDAVVRNLDDVSLHWASNAFRPRRYRSDRGVALVGDAAGVFHPLTAMGITMSLLDAECLAETSSLDAYAERRTRETYVPELLSNAIYQAFARDDSGTLAVRDSIFRTWRDSVAQRDRTMDLLGAATTRRSDFVRAFARVAFDAGAEVLSTEPSTARELAQWLRWPWASVHPRPSVMRARSVTWASPASWQASGGGTAHIGEVEHAS